MKINKIRHLISLSARTLVTLFFCGLFIISNVAPAQATPSKVTDGEVSLTQIQNKTDDVANSDPRSIKEVAGAAQEGLNSVQGGADKDKMISAKDAENATTVKEQAAELLKDFVS